MSEAVQPVGEYPSLASAYRQFGGASGVIEALRRENARLEQLWRLAERERDTWRKRHDAMRGSYQRLIDLKYEGGL